MTKNPILNAIAAFVYIIIVVTIITMGQKFAGPKDSAFTPVAVLSLLTLSAAFMAYDFFYQPFQLYFDDKKKQALDLVVKTIGAFAVITVIILFLVFSKILH